MDSIQLSFSGQNLPKLDLELSELQLEDYRNRAVEIMLHQQMTRLESLCLKNISGGCDISSISEFGSLKYLELSQIYLQPQKFTVEKFPCLEELLLSDLGNQSVFEEISKLSETLVDLTLVKIDIEQIVSMNLQNKILNMIKNMPQLMMLTLVNFNIDFNFGSHLSKCSKLNDLAIKNYASQLKSQVANSMGRRFSQP